MLVAALSWPSLAAHAQSRLSPAQAIADSARREIEAAQFVADTTKLDAMRAYLRRAMQRFPNDPLLEHYAGYATFRRANLIPDSQPQRLLPMLIEARGLLERSIRHKPMPESYAVLSSVVGRQIAFYPKGGDTLIMQAQAATMSGLNLHSENPRVWLMNGIAAFYTMPEHGGGYPVVEKLLRRAIRFFESERVQPPMPSWGHAEAYCWLGQALAKQKKYDDARVAYARALEIEPEFGWVKYVLMPELAVTDSTRRGQ